MAKEEQEQQVADRKHNKYTWESTFYLCPAPITDATILARVKKKTFKGFQKRGDDSRPRFFQWEVQCTVELSENKRNATHCTSDIITLTNK